FSTRPCSHSARSRADRTLLAIASGERRKSSKYRLPLARSRTIRSVQRSPMRSSVQATAQSDRLGDFDFLPRFITLDFSCLLQASPYNACRTQVTRRAPQVTSRIASPGGSPMKLADHPTVKAFYEKSAAAPAPAAPTPLDANWLRQLCREAGADDVGLV